MLANARQPSQGPNSRAAAAPTATQNARLWLHVPWKSGRAQPARMTSESALGRNCAAVTTANVSGRGSSDAIASAIPRWPNCIVLPVEESGTRCVHRFKPTSSHGLVSVSASLPGGDHLLQHDVALDRGREHVAPGIGGEPALPLEHVEGLSD